MTAIHTHNNLVYMNFKIKNLPQITNWFLKIFLYKNNINFKSLIKLL